MLLHVAMFTLRCVMTTGWFAVIFAWELPANDSRSEKRLDEAQRLVRELPTIRHRAGAGGSAPNGARFELSACVVCLHEYVEGEELCVLGCGHYWHAECLSKWLSHRRTCPLCQRWDSREPRDQQPAAPVGAAAAGTAAAAAAGEARRRRHHELPPGDA